MSTDDTSDGEPSEGSVNSDATTGDGHGGDDSEHGDELVGSDVRERLGESADKAIDQFDEGLIDLLAWMLETETRARIYISLRSAQEQTSDEIAERTGLYPSTVREALASLHEDGIVTRDKRQNAGAGNNPYEYSAIPPSDLVGEVVDDIQDHLNAVFNLDNYMDRTESAENDSDPVTITVTEEREDETTDDSATADGSGTTDENSEDTDDE
ncbi:Predicted transcriptional regulator [Halovenus aranensis]|uniref:Predicted transcriptional regulator n=1 Tax=Halovenus aranensis TaxID=890420 RepID=A0A1G8V6J9_9EURY|nr:helix-turn-helix domain-containing protein [Halovenus aranensis]SDJ61722.1 Predicted transcriptional regulator [Halovenus aranensis]